MKKKHPLYDFFITLPDRLYPFAVTIEGKKVRGKESYQKQLETVLEKYGVGKLGYKLMAYRQACHLLGSLLFLASVTLIAQILFDSVTALYFLLVAAILAITYQEFYLHPRTHGQHLKKGVLDWVVWTAPLFIYAGIYLF